MNPQAFRRKLQTELDGKGRVLEVRISDNPSHTAHIVRMLVHCRGEAEPVLFRKVIQFGVSLVGIPKACADEIAQLRGLVDPPLEKVNLTPEVLP